MSANEEKTSRQLNLTRLSVADVNIVNACLFSVSGASGLYDFIF